MRKYALGVHHINIAYNAGNEPSYHRQVRESLVPLLDLLTRHPTWCFPVEMSGYSIEFLANRYPTLLQRLRTLIHDGRIELISATYAPQIWIGFPLADMLRSIAINRELLQELSLPVSRIFFAQENFSGQGIIRLSEWFDTAVLKDDYYLHLHDMPQLAPYTTLGALKVLMGWNHILQVAERTGRLHQPDDYVYHEHRQMLTDAHTRFDTSRYAAENGVCGDLAWTWYHIGSSERFAKPHIRPDHIPGCYHDPYWTDYLERCLEQYEAEGYQFTSITQFVHEASQLDFQAEPCKPLLEGSWNMAKAQGGYIWMGHNANPHEDDLMVRNHCWRSRSRLMALDMFLKTRQPHLPPEMREELKKAWKAQLLAEVSDATGWYPERIEVQFSLQQADTVLNTVTRIMNHHKLAGGGRQIIDTATGALLAALPHHHATRVEQGWIALNLYGGTGSINYYTLSESQQQVTIHLAPDADKTGISLPIDLAWLAYCPSLMEDEPVHYDWQIFKPDVLCLPLTNGLIRIDRELFLIKHNEWMNIACQVSQATHTAFLEIEHPHERPLHWVLTLFRGTLEEAVHLANRINVTPVVVL